MIDSNNSQEKPKRFKVISTKKIPDMHINYKVQ